MRGRHQPLPAEVSNLHEIEEFLVLGSAGWRMWTQCYLRRLLDKNVWHGYPLFETRLDLRSAKT